MLSVGQQPTNALSNSSLLVQEGLSFFPGILFKNKSYMPQFVFQDAVTPMMQGIIHLPGDITCISFSLVLSFFLPFFLTLCKRRFYYFPQTGFGDRRNTIEILGTIFTRIFLVLILIRNSHEVTHCAGSGEASSANHNVPPGSEGTSGGNSGWTSILGSSSGERCHAPNPTKASEREHPLTTSIDHSATSPGDPADPTRIRV